MAAAAVAAQLALAGSASAVRTGGGSAAHHMAGTIAPLKVNLLDCNGHSTKYTSAAGSMPMRCTDPLGRLYYGHWHRFYDNGHYVGHDEPSVKFISSVKGSGNTMDWALRLPKDPARHRPPAAASPTTQT